MASSFVDLHVHSTASDGTFAPAEVARLVKQSGLAGFALTDHDTVGGVREAAEESARLGIEFLPGVEISAEWPRPGTLHLLGYGIDSQSPAMMELARSQVDARNERNPKIIARLRELGVAITLEEVREQSGGEVIGRPHIAGVLVKKGYVSSARHAFEKYLGQGGAACFNRQRLAPRTAIDMIRRAGGLPVLAHPIQVRAGNDAQLARIVKDLADMGLAGIEVIHSDHTRELASRYSEIADRYHLLKTGGSDFHGMNKQEIALGVANGMRIPRLFLDDLMRRREALLQRT